MSAGLTIGGFQEKLRIRETIGIKWEAARKELRKNSGKEHIEYTEKETGK